MFSVDLRLRYINYQIPRNMENVFQLNGVLTLSDSLLPHHQIFQEMKILFYERVDLCPQEAKTTSKKKKIILHSGAAPNHSNPLTLPFFKCEQS
jgi:hypothetical protein